MSSNRPNRSGRIAGNRFFPVFWPHLHSFPAGGCQTIWGGFGPQRDKWIPLQKGCIPSMKQKPHKIPGTLPEPGADPSDSLGSGHSFRWLNSGDFPPLLRWQRLFFVFPKGVKTGPQSAHGKSTPFGARAMFSQCTQTEMGGQRACGTLS